MASGADAAPTLPTHIHIQMCKDRENGAKANDCGWREMSFIDFSVCAQWKHFFVYIKIFLEL